VPSPLRLAAAIVLCAGWIIGARICMRLPMPWRSRLFALLNVGTVASLLYLQLTLHPKLFALYLAILVVHHALVRRFAASKGSLPWLAFALPIAFLVTLKYLPVLSPSSSLFGVAAPQLGLYFIGVSYMAFRLSQLVLEVRNGVAPMPDLATYLGFAFFIPTIAVGPISPYHLYWRSLVEPDSTATPPGRLATRIVIGATKYLFLAHLCNRLSYRGLLLDGHPHGALDLTVSAFAYYLYLYCNFSGFCDLAIGAAGLAGIRVAENFDHPLSARNVREFWNRWHITLSTYMRDVLFTPLSKAGARALGPRYTDHVIALVTMLVFLVVGVWHGVGWGFFIFGALHGAGVVANHYYGLALVRLLGKPRVRAYRESATARAVAVIATQAYVAATFFFFANDGVSIRRIVAALLLRSSLYDPVF
jgi:D-alanyl-lipoteichoic acid acyltransferase DltB (MBOAT superfamily)